MLYIVICLLLSVACSACAANQAQVATGPNCQAGGASPGSPGYNACLNQPDSQLGVHFGGTVSVGTVVR